ncbi:MAG: LamG-like jellyroll fold domain-containing protein [Verrucomicrobiales bacterium]
MKLKKYLPLCLSLALTIGVSNAQIPAPYLYYDFEDAAGSTSVIDSSGNDREGAVTGDIQFGEEGAPQGSTPGTGAAFSIGGTGYITVEGSDSPTDFGNRDQGVAMSYTMSCWVKPDQQSFSGDAFIFGQGSQGIHNGFRGGNTYHAHWGSDFSGTLPLNPDEWAHLTFTYDSELGRGAIYVNGEFDSEKTDQTGPNGSGPVLIGVRNNGEHPYHGLIDDLAMWQVALDEDQIKALAEGLSPSGRDNEDDDEDGLPDYYEENLVDNLDDLNGNGAGPGPGSGTGDFDGDGLTDLDEYEETKTNPTLADTDEDGLSDGVETNTGTFVSATNTGTNPKKADTDKDGLIDSVETNTGVLVDEENTGTSPLNKDSDGDGYSDGGEIAGGTDPNDENSKGALPAPFLYLDFEENAVDLSGNANDGEVDGDVTFDVEGAEGGPSPTTGASFNGGHLDFPSIDMNSMIRDFDTGSYTFACWMKPIGSAGGQGFMWGQTDQGIHNGIRNGGLLHSAHWGADWNASTVLEAEQWVHAAWTYDGDTDTATIYLNGQVDGGPQAQRAANGGGTFIFGGRNNGELTYNGYVDDVTIWREVLPEGSIQALADGTSPIGATQEDDDEDGLPDAWEEKYGVDDPEGDPDGDGLTNVEEFELRTKPDKADSDEDGLSDKAEIEIHETNPLNPDADRDGLLDGEEIAAGTDPDKRDTDEDGITDFNEIQDGTDPLVKTEIAFDTNLVSYWSMDGTFDNVHTDDYHGEEQSGPIEFQTGKFGDAAYLNGSQSILISGDENAFDFAGESFTVSAWYTAEVIDKSWQCLIAKGEGNGWRVHRRGGDNPPEMTFTGGNGDVDRHNVAMTVGEDPETWHHVAGVTDSSTQEQILYLDGEEVARKSGATLADRGNPMRIGDNPDAANRNWQGKVDDVAIWGRALAPFEVADIWNGGDGKSIEEMLGLAIPFEFTNIIYNAAEDGFRLQWNSKPNKTYALYFSESLAEFDADIDDSITSQGETTVYPGEDEWLPNPLEGAPKLFFRIEENQ